MIISAPIVIITNCDYIRTMLACSDLYLVLMSVDPYQSALKGHFDLGLHYLLRRSKLQYQ